MPWNLLVNEVEVEALSIRGWWINIYSPGYRERINSTAINKRDSLSSMLLSILINIINWIASP